MAIFIFGALLLVALMFVATLARRRGNASERDSVAESIQIHKSRLQALDEEHQRGDLEDTDYQQFKEETERALLEDTRKAGDTDPGRAVPLFVVVATGVVMSGAAWGLYGFWGASDAVEVRNNFIALASDPDPTEADLMETLDGYEALLQEHPDDMEGWFRLANMQMELGQFSRAQPTLERVLTLLREGPRNAEDESMILAYLGQTLWAQEQAEPALERFQEALEYNAQNTLALGFAGRLTFELQSYRSSIDYWTRLKRLAGDTADTRLIDEFIGRSRVALSEQGIDYEADLGPSIDVRLALPTAWEGLPETAVLFVYARPDGSRMPLAVRRVPVSSRDMRVVLTDADAMGGMGGLSGQGEVVISARVSFQGVAEPAAGDWEAEDVILDLTEQSDFQVDLEVRQP
ncbi:c-type cytochrome biogenesis protein CcmI [Saccharospirillum impatiens]|uniref:c-type cytochrome biogenesis protein CcmI n=1 Tax=Saccharospirillum impatiens TaxID=169438 RepID=UPI000409457F|nr:c-type cytochrome biogenesis protein CcmI [Saccharospirillum impatiens]